MNEVIRNTGTKTAAEWAIHPPLNDDQYVDTRIYTDPAIFSEEIEKIWKKVWYIACHESELPEVYDYRTFSIANTPIVITRGEDGSIRAFLNACPHRGNVIVRRPAGSFRNADPSGNPKHMTCLFHGWQWDTMGRCVEIPRCKNGYQDRYAKKDAALREIKSETAYGGFVWINLDDNCQPLGDYIGHAMDCYEVALRPELEVFHYHRAVLKTNYKLWHDTNSEFYHDYMHYHNRATGMMQPGYFERKYHCFANGHASVDGMTIKYDSYEGFSSRKTGWPGVPQDGWLLVDLFPGATYNLRGSALRIDTVTPLAPDKVIIEFRGLGLKDDTPEQRAARIKDHNTIWGPFGRNLPEDLLGIIGQGVAMKRGGTGSKFVLHGRIEDEFIHDEIGMRHYYAEWSRRLDRPTHDPRHD